MVSLSDGHDGSRHGEWNRGTRRLRRQAPAVQRTDSAGAAYGLGRLGGVRRCRTRTSRRERSADHGGDRLRPDAWALQGDRADDPGGHLPASVEARQTVAEGTQRTDLRSGPDPRRPGTRIPWESRQDTRVSSRPPTCCLAARRLSTWRDRVRQVPRRSSTSSSVPKPECRCSRLARATGAANGPSHRRPGRSNGS